MLLIIVINILLLLYKNTINNQVFSVLLKVLKYLSERYKIAYIYCIQHWLYFLDTSVLHQYLHV